jgi:hypothetical protein
MNSLGDHTDEGLFRAIHQSDGADRRHPLITPHKRAMSSPWTKSRLSGFPAT